MNMSIGPVNRALSCAFLGLILCASPGLAQRAPNRQAAAAPNRATARASRKIQHTPNRYILFLQDQPVSERFRAREEWQTAAAIAYRQQVESRQQAVKQDLASRNIMVAGSVSTLLNAIFVVAPPGRVAELRSVSGVIGVMPERVVKRSLNQATSLANAPAAWAQAAIGGQANAGNGIKIGILDTGIDQTNPAFSDTGYSTVPSGFPKCNVPSDCTNYTNKKVIVARSYVPMIAAGSNPANLAADSRPDDFSARDRDGHGSAVAAAAAGSQTSGVAVAFSGMAPKAYLGSYKIFGSDYVSDGFTTESVMIQALSDAVSDGMNIVDMSSTSPAVSGWQDDVQCGNPAGVRCDPLAYAFEKAAEAGLVITVAAGNDGSDAFYIEGIYPDFNSISSPGTAPSVITVGATINSHVLNPSVTVNAAGAPAGLTGISAAMSDSYFLPSGVGANAAPLVDVTKLGDTGYACSSLPANSLIDKYALIQDGGTCSGNYDLKATNASAAGAVGVVFYMATSSTTLINPEGICAYTSASIYPVCDLYGPAVMISLSAGQTLKTYIDANPGALVTIDTAGGENLQISGGVINTLASYSSDGPSLDGLIKPDLVATGGYDGNLPNAADDTDSLLPAPRGLYTAGQNYDPNGALFSTSRYVAVDGTSFSAALVAGAAALVLQAHPTWKAAQIKSALVNNSAQDVTTDDFGNPVDVEWIGAGRLNANAAVAATVTAVPSTLSFGYLKSGVALPNPIAVTVTNTGTSSVTLAVKVVAGVNSASTTTAAIVTPSQPSLTLAACSSTPCPSTTLTVTLSGAVPAAGEYSGAVTLTSTSPSFALTLPYLFLVGDGSNPTVVPLYSDVLYGSVGQDLGQIPVQVVDIWGVPVAGTPVTFTMSPSGAATFKPVTGTPGSTGSALPFQPSSCTPGTSSLSVTCNTNNYGIAWVELIGGATPYDLLSGDATVNVTAAGESITPAIYLGLVPQPTLTFVRDAALGGLTISPGSYVSLYGSNLVDPDNLANPAGDTADTTYTSGRLPLTLDGVTVSFDAAAQGGLSAISLPGYVYFVSPGQVNVWVPYELAGYSSVQVKVTLSQGIFSNVMTVPVNTYTPAFLMNISGSLLISDARDNTTGALITTSNPATAGETLQLYCNGLGPVTNPPPSGSPAPVYPNMASTVNPVTVSIGGKNASVISAVLAPPWVGLYQVDVTVPSGLASGNQPVTVSVAGLQSPTSVLIGTATYNIVLPVK
jgi:uncharacterized protein (TIGR03437 family)